MVVLISFIFLKVRYHPTQIVGILICIGGVGILFGSDHITQGSGFGGVTGGNQLKGDLFALAGATFYGMSNVAEEFLVSKRPLYEVVGQLGFWGMFIDGAMTGIFDRPQYKTSVWNDGKVGGYLTGYTLLLLIFYSGMYLFFGDHPEQLGQGVARVYFKSKQPHSPPCGGLNILQGPRFGHHNKANQPLPHRRSSHVPPRLRRLFQHQPTHR